MFRARAAPRAEPLGSSEKSGALGGAVAGKLVTERPQNPSQEGESWMS
ncbi:Uncharacterised protein [Mycobacteroides abscessus subsp. abscessus]|nr:Uncharacterised protein [Mycobacteroides abscessus subsp. abscessus]